LSVREVALVIYGGMLGWYLHKWWEREREYLVWRSAERAAALSAAKAESAETPPTV